MSLPRATAATEAILAYEDYTNLREIWEASHEEQREFEYIVNPSGVVTKVVGSRASIGIRLLSGVDFTNTCTFHTHPNCDDATLSAGDIKAALWRYEHRNSDGMGVIAKYTYLYAEIIPKIADDIIAEKKKISAAWKHTINEFYKYKEEGHTELANACVRQARSYKAQKGSLTQAAREGAFDMVIEDDTYW